ncbi:MAG: M23 family metallopeptidase [Prevotella sp.]|uniref:M23 family metallopeptidase n=1 Tax=Segatella cerevisiae TaxID=2053716 RepID=A0ABT1BYV8_9BACT|nr:M23 family metallopeptidase [Segatella cerevisiae]MCH3995674.1 M23 family metallopeptidase [Prevotella sp.]MCI1246973.1 M23 family metallopeptidase [Prevotella sp.]MCO6025880.1 M23 family metallopeptidase [Segatella cerevisiae]
MNFLFCLLLAAVTYGSPVHYPIELAGNFAEPRPNHFHGGCDVKTGQVTGKAIHSIGDGYVSHVSIGVGGYGNAVYVQHPEGYTSVYGHLKAFSLRVQAVLRKHQYAEQRTTGVFDFRPDEVPVAEGDFIAWSGNTGASEGPHLHLEVHSTKDGNMHDPLAFIGRYVTDHVPPLGHGFMACPMPGKGSFDGGSGDQVFGLTSHHLSNRFTAWGKVGFAIWANDNMEATYNNYGVRLTQLFVDGKLVFQSDANNIPINGNLQVNYWGDYQHYIRSNVWYMRSFLLPGITLPVFKVGKDRGVIDFNQQRPYHIEYVLSDFAGNASHYDFIVEGRKMAIAPYRKPAGPELFWNRFNIYPLAGARLILKHHLLADDVVIHPRVIRQPGKYSDAYHFMPGSYPLLGFGRIAIHLNKSVADPSKLYIASHFGKERYMGGVYKNGWVTGPCRDLGAIYDIDCDDKAPSVIPVGQGGWTARRQLTFSLGDTQSGLKGFKGFVDGHFVAFDQILQTPLVRCDLAEAPVRKTGREHQLKFIAWDQKNNQRVFVTQFKY